MRHAFIQILGVNSSPHFCVKVWVSISNLVLLFDRVAFRPTDQEEEEEEEEEDDDQDDDDDDDAKHPSHLSTPNSPARRNARSDPPPLGAAC